METQEKKPYTPNKLIGNLIRLINENRVDLFYKVCAEYAQAMPTGGKFRHELLQLLRQKPAQLMRLDDMSKDIKKFISIGSQANEHVFLSDSIAELLADLLLEWGNVDVFAMHNLPVRRKLLLYGPTGNGKTTIARHIARASGLPFVEVHADMIIDSGLGSTGGNIHKLFKGVQEECILFWDEIDTIGRKRSSGAGGASEQENDRIVNSILLNLEKLNPNVVLIGATNRMEVLDPAFLRRFDCKIEVPLPTESQKKDYVNSLVCHHNLSKMIADNTISGDSYNELRQCCLEVARRMILTHLSS